VTDGRVVRPLTLGDAAELARLLSAGRVPDAPFVPARGDAFFTAAGQRARIEAAEHLCGIVDHGALVGTISLSNVVPAPFESATLGYWVAAEHRRRGLATKAVAAVAGRAFGELGLHRLEAATLVDNVASQHVLERNGFTRIGLAPRYLHIAGAWRDHVLFQRTVED
jgi:ribosomal-protein-alanine N-acetyltransferase